MDKFGCKPFIILFLFGRLLSDIGILFNFAFIEHLPLQFFYIETLVSFCGGFPMYYLGMYLGNLYTGSKKNGHLKNWL